MEIWTAFTIGALGSFHCVGMCGPIALALPLDRQNRLARIFGAIVYNTGRVFTYALVGSIFGLLGRGFIMVGTQQWVSVAVGMLILVSVLLPTAVKYRMSPNSGVSRLISQLKRKMGGLLRQRNYRSLLAIGVLNGFLPCGLVYLAVAGAIATGTFYSGAAFMAAFGLGTLPVMLVATLLGNLLSLRVRGLIRKSMPVIIACIGLLFIARGLDLGIPYISPSVNTTQVLDCCQ